MGNFSTLLLIALPFVIINIGIIIYVVIDIHKEEREVIGLTKGWWTVVVILVSFAWVVYLLAGRKQ